MTSWLRRQFTRWNARLLDLVARHRKHSNLTLVAVAFDSEVEESLLDWLDQAMQELHRHHPVAIRYLDRHVDRIYAWDLVNRWGEWRSDERAIAVDQEVVNAGLPGLAAAVIVHELTHARLEAHGFTYDEVIRDRIEGVCHRRELAFMERASLPAPLIEAKRDRAKNPGALSDSELLAQYYESRMGTLERAQTFPWLLAAFRWIADRRLRRASAAKTEESPPDPSEPAA